MEETYSLESLLEDVREICRTRRVSFKEAKKLLENMVGTDTIIDYYISLGPFPLREDVRLDIFILSPSFLYNLDIRRSVSLCHRLFLPHLMLIEERPERTKERGYYIVYHFFAGTHELMLREKTTMRDKAEKFCSKIKDAIVATQQSKR